VLLHNRRQLLSESLASEATRHACLWLTAAAIDRSIESEIRKARQCSHPRQRQPDGSLSHRRARRRTTVGAPCRGPAGAAASVRPQARRPAAFSGCLAVAAHLHLHLLICIALARCFAPTVLCLGCRCISPFPVAFSSPVHACKRQPQLVGDRELLACSSRQGKAAAGSIASYRSFLFPAISEPRFFS